MGMSPWIEWKYPLCGGKGGGSTTTVVNPPAMTADQTALQHLQLQQAQTAQAQMPMNYALNDPQGAQAYLKKGDFSDTTSPFFGLEKLPNSQQRIDQAATSYSQNQDIYNQAQNLLTQQLTGKASLTPDQTKNLNAMDESQRSQYSDLRRRYAGETAGRLGLYTSDSPIQGDVARQDTQFQSNLAATRASSELNLGEANRNYTANITGMQNSLNQSAMNNRQVVSGFGQQTQLGLGNNLSNQYMQAYGNTQRAYQPQNNWISPALGALGGLGMGAAMMFK